LNYKKIKGLSGKQILYTNLAKTYIMKKYSFLIILVLILGFVSRIQAQPSAEAKWNFTAKYLTAKDIEVSITIEIPETYHLYSFDQIPGGGTPASIKWDLPQGVTLNGGLVSTTEPHKYFDEIFQVDTRDFSGTVVWKQLLSVKENKEYSLKGSYTYQLCNDEGCTMPFPIKFEFKTPKFKGVKMVVTNSPTQEEVGNSNEVNEQLAVKSIEDSTVDVNSKDTTITKEEIAKNDVGDKTDEESQTPWWIFIMGFVGGLLAFLTPCVFPMVPMTVSLFIKKERKIGIRDALIYGLSIIVIYVGLGLTITGVFGESALYNLSTNAIFNTLFFLIFMVFAVSFFGAFELTLPSSWVNKMDQKVDKTSGLISVFFMAFTLVLVSFSCTAMIIGTLLVESVHSGSVLGPFMGMLGFSVALALPFTLFAIFPSLLKSMPKSGGWLNTIKVVLGFVELALALKFLSMADLAAGWELLPRHIFLSIWIVIMVLLGLYILGKLKFVHDSDLKYISIPRLLFAIASFSFALYLLPGMWGAPLKPLSGYLPPLNTQEFDLYTPTLRSGTQVQSVDEFNETRKYSDKLHSPLGLHTFFDYNEGLAYAKKVNKPVLLDFTGKTCANCRDIEMRIWSQAPVLKHLDQDFVVISLYLDAQYDLPEEEQITEQYEGREYEIQTIGDKWKFFSLKHYKTIAQPLYVILDTNGNELMSPIAYTEAKQNGYFLNFLQEGLKKFNK